MNDEPLSPQDKRERLVGSYQDSYRKLGVEPDLGDLERQVVADLELVDAADRAGEITTSAAASAPLRESVVPGRKTARELVRDDSAEAGTPLELRYDEENAAPVRSALFDGDIPDEQWRLARGRCRRIAEGATPSRRSDGSYKIDWSTANHPELAQALHELTAFYLLRDRPPIVGKTSHNPFLGLSELDAQRLLRRKVIDICDRSTGRLGPWYVK